MIERDCCDPDWDEQCAANYRKIKEALRAPPDPETLANLERIQSRQDELEALSRKKVSEISPSEALQLIWEQRLRYPDAAEYFEKWWDSLGRNLQKKINVAA